MATALRVATATQVSWPVSDTAGTASRAGTATASRGHDTLYRGTRCRGLAAGLLAVGLGVLVVLAGLSRAGEPQWPSPRHPRRLRPRRRPHLAPVLELPEAAQAFRRYVPLFLSARDEADQASEKEVWGWLCTHQDDAAAFVCGLLTWAELTLREAFGPEVARESIDVAERLRASCHAAGLDPLVIEGYLTAAPLVQDTLNGAADTVDHLLERLCETPTLVWGAALGLADITIETARRKRGSAGAWIATMRYLSTGQGAPQLTVRVPDPSAQLAAVLGEPAAGEPGQARPSQPGNLPEVVVGARLVPSFLCYRDAGASRCEHELREWLREHPSHALGFLAALAGLAHELLRAGHGTQIHTLTSDLTNTAATGADWPAADAASVDCPAEFAEGYRSAAPLLQHLARYDNLAADTLPRHLQETLSLTWGTATALAHITLTTAQTQFGSANEFVHFLHSWTTAATTDDTSPGLHQTGRWLNPARHPQTRAEDPSGWPPGHDHQPRTPAHPQVDTQMLTLKKAADYRSRSGGPAMSQNTRIRLRTRGAAGVAALSAHQF